MQRYRDALNDALNEVKIPIGTRVRYHFCEVGKVIGHQDAYTLLIDFGGGYHRLCAFKDLQI